MKTKMLLAILLLAIILSLFFTYDRSMVRKDFEVYEEEAL